MACQRLGCFSLALLQLVVILLVPPLAHAQGVKNFRVTWNVEKTNPTTTEIAGTVTNDARLEAFDVYVTAEALNDKGKVVSRGLTHVGQVLGPSATQPFVAKVPVVPGIASYRVVVSSFRFGLGAGQSP